MESSAEYDRRVMTLLACARTHAAGDRESFLRSACGGDAQLFQEVAEALAWEARMGSFLAAPLMNFIDLARPFEPGDVVAGRFEIQREIGEGGMGVVYEAFDRRRRQRIAIKAAKPGFQTLLSPELEGALRVRHPNICLVNEIHSTPTAQGAVDFLTMEYVAGTTLSAYLGRNIGTQGALSQAEALDIARQICAGVAAAHGSDILHRDLKASNVMVCEGTDGQRRVVIMDFGLAGSEATPLAELAGTPAYMAPELLTGGQTSKASDIYALGIILRELAAAGGFSDARWERTIRRCLERNPGARFDDATQVADSLESRWLRKDRMLAGVALLVLMLALLSLQPTVRQWLADHLWPPASNVRLAILPVTGDGDATSAMGGVLQDVAGRVAKMRSAHRTIVVLSPLELADSRVTTLAQAKSVMHATHALRTAVRQDGAELVLHASVVNLDTNVTMGESTGRYPPATLGNLPSALAGAVSLALRLDAAAAAEKLTAAAALPYDQGLHYLHDDDADDAKAIPLLEQAARADRSATLPLAALIEAEIRLFESTKDASRIEAARRVLQEAQSVNPDSVAVLLAAGRLGEATGEYERARENYQRVQEIDPRNVEAYLRMASIDDALEMPERAIDSYRKAINLDPGYFKPYHHFGVFYYYRGRYREAAEQFQKAIEHAPGRVDAYTSLAAALSDAGDDDAAERALRASLDIRETAGAWNSLGAIRAYQDRDAEALGFYERAVTLDSGSYVYWLNLGDAARRSGSHERAATAYRNALELARAQLAQNPRFGLPRAYAAYFTARLGDLARAADDIAEAMKFSPGDTKVMRRAVLTYEAMGRRDDALQILARLGPGILGELARHPDLADLSRDVRFRKMLEKP
jgi:tetratricopeptide (TPR) repeat protein